MAQRARIDLQPNIVTKIYKQNEKEEQKKNEHQAPGLKAGEEAQELYRGRGRPASWEPPRGLGRGGKAFKYLGAAAPGHVDRPVG